MPGDTEIRYRRMVGDLCVDQDRHDFGVLEILRDEDELLVLMAQSTWDFVARFNLRRDFVRLDEVEPGMYSLGHFVGRGVNPEPLVFEMPAAWLDEVDDLRRHAAEADPDVDYCVAAPGCLQDVIHRGRGYPICAYHDQQLSGVDALIDG